MKIVIKPGSQLTDSELKALSENKTREWQLPPIDPAKVKNQLFVLLQDDQSQILAQAQLLPVDNVRFNNQTFSIVGIGGVIATQKGQGYGKKLMQGVIDYLKQTHKTAVGFTGLDVIGFYEKSGFTPEYTSLKRFIHQDGNARITNQTEDAVFYWEGQDKFMSRVLKRPELDILLPRDPDW